MEKQTKKLTSRQGLLLSYAIYNAQDNRVSKFYIKDFQKKFNIGEYTFIDLKEDSKELLGVSFKSIDKWSFKNLILHISYDEQGLLEIEFSPELIENVLDFKLMLIEKEDLFKEKLKREFIETSIDSIENLQGFEVQYRG